MIDRNEIPTGWKYCRNQWAIWNGKDRTIYKDRESVGYSISENQVWMPGHYETLDAAILAFSLGDEILSKTQARKNEENGSFDGVITLADLNAAKGEREE